MGKTIGLAGLFRMASGASKGGGESYAGDHRSAGNTGGAKARISRVKGGGGRKDFAQAGGVDETKIEDALDKLKSLI